MPVRIILDGPQTSTFKKLREKGVVLVAWQKQIGRLQVARSRTWSLGLGAFGESRALLRRTIIVSVDFKPPPVRWPLAPKIRGKVYRRPNVSDRVSLLSRMEVIYAS